MYSNRQLKEAVQAPRAGPHELVVYVHTSVARNRRSAYILQCLENYDGLCRYHFVKINTNSNIPLM